MRRLFFAFLLLALASSGARAHNPGLSSLLCEVEGDRLALTLQLTPPDPNGDGRASEQEFTDGETQLRTLSPRWLDASDPQGSLTVIAGAITRRTDQSVLEWRATIPLRGPGPLKITLRQLGELSSGHREFVSIVQAGRTLAEGLLSAQNPAIEFSYDRLAPTHTFTDFVRLGIRHILTGYDHLLYLAGLILACHRFRSILPIITSFTVAHSLTLGMATVGVWSLSPGWVEPLIAASIVYVGIENLWMRDREPRHRWITAGMFGLVHGFGFAGLLREIGVGQNGSSVLVPLFSFNLGVELGQLCIVALILPVLAWARSRPRFAERGAPALSLLVAGFGLYWLVERVWS